MYGMVVFSQKVLTVATEKLIVGRLCCKMKYVMRSRSNVRQGWSVVHLQRIVCWTRQVELASLVRYRDGTGSVAFTREMPPNRAIAYFLRLLSVPA